MVLWYYGIMVYIVFYKLFVCRGRRKREFIFRTCFWKNEHGANGNKQFLTKFHYMAPQAKPLWPWVAYRNSVLGGGPKV